MNKQFELLEFVFDSVYIEWMRGLGLGFTNPVRTGGVLDVCLCLSCGSVCGVCGEWVGAWTRVWRGGVMSV